MVIERPEAVIFRGQPQTVIGQTLKPGDNAPDFKLLANDHSEVTLADSRGKVRLISVVSALDTGVCDVQTRRFNQEADNFGGDVVILTVSVDLPATQKRWCGAAGVDRVQTLSDHRDMNFGDAYGTHVKELRQEQRAIFVVDRDDMIRYAEYVPKIGQHPDYDAALSALREVID
ncbi:MAG: thiol peroxidase [Anaerolineales bacterium]|nr:MAG: thiol peroxidase [Anaerolineales bacterium]